MIDLRTIERSGRPNQFIVAPKGYLASETADMTPPTYPDDPAALTARLMTHLRGKNGAEELKADGRRLSYVARIPLFRFKDDVDIEVLDAEGGSTLAVFSRSRVGHADLGVNARRVKGLLAALQG